MKKIGFQMRFVLIALTIVLLTSCGKGCQKKESALDLVPSNNNILMSFNMKKLMSTSLYADMEKDIPAESKEVKEVLKDVDDVLVAVSMPDANAKPTALIIINGKLDEKKITDLMEAEAKKKNTEVKKETFEGKTILSSSANEGIVFLSANQALFGDIAPLKQAISLSAKKGESIRSNKELVALYDDRDANKIFWAAGVVPALPGGTAAPQPGNPLDSLKAIKTFSLSMDYNKDLTIDVVGNTPDSAKAQELSNTLNAFKTTSGAMMAQADPRLNQLVQGIQITNKDKALKISLKIPESLVQDFSKEIKNKKAGMTPPPAMPSDDTSAPIPPPPAPNAPPAPPAEQPAPPPAQ